MADFDTTRLALDTARGGMQSAQKALDEARQATARLQARYDSTLRYGRGQGSGESARLAGALAAARRDEADKREALKAAKAVAAERAEAFAPFADPRQAIGQWSDDIPLLLFPVRLETRFKTVHDDGAAREELWVRIYPDTCSVDTFEAQLSESEVVNGRRFWVETWAAGGVEAQRRSAWRNLTASHGAGRAAWIVKQYAPAGAPPAKAKGQDIVLVIAADALLTSQEQAALSAYWKEVWLAEGDRQRIEAALQALAATPGVADAQSLIERFKPANLAAAPLAPARRSDMGVSVAWLTLPAPPAAKTRSWTAPARINVLPDRFLLLGWQDDRLVIEALGDPIPSPLVAGPDPSAPADEQFAHDADGDLVTPAEMRWMVDFEAAVAAGMGVKARLDTTRVDLSRPLQRVMAIGLRLAEDGDKGPKTLEQLLQHHRYGRAGLALLPQGSPTNNTDDPAAYDRIDDADAAYDALFTDKDALPVDTGDWWLRRDGQWLSDALGIGADTFDRVPNAAGSDLAEARAMNRALWPATFGYAMETMLHSVFDSGQVDAARWYQTHFVTGRGMLPSLRIGDQPYGILPVSAISQWTWLGDDRLHAIDGLQPPNGFLAFRQGLAKVLAAMRQDWARLAEAVSHVGKSGDPHQLLLDVIGLHPASVEFHQRYAESLDHLFNRAKLQGLAAQILEMLRVNALQAEAITLLRRLGYAGELEPEALSKFFFMPANRLNGPLIDDRPVSERAAVRAYTADQRNYLKWLLDAARGSFEELRQERGFLDNRSPQALLYVMLRHALLLGYFDESLRLHLEADVLDGPAASLARKEPSFVHVAAAAESESRFARLYSTDARVTGGETIVAERVRKLIGAAGVQGLSDQLAAIELLKDAPTARLERCLAEHIDLASFRLDAWLLGLVNYQLAALRYRPGRGDDGVSSPVKRGIHLGAYGWLENLQRKAAPLQPVRLDPELDRVFNKADEPPLQRDPSNGGYVLAPSINQATTATILRAGYLANASPQAPGALAVNLSSGHVRVALSLIEGIRNGQPLGALLGYRFQRGLHEGHPGLELDRFIYPLRKQFPLVADQMASTQTPEGTPIEAIEANNVLDGLKLIERVSRPGMRAYPFGLSLPPASAAERAAIDAEVDALLDAHDALADLALAEGVHQAVLGNYDRVAATFDAYAKGGFPPEPEVVRTPRSGLAITHRAALHFRAGVDPDASPIAGMAMTPRAVAQAMVNAWLADILPAPVEVACRVEWFDPVANVLREDKVTQADLALQPIDMLYVVTLDGDAALGELEDRILRHIVGKHSPRPDAAITIRHTARLAAPMVSFFELAPLVGHLASLVLGFRPLAPTDLSLSGEAEKGQDGAQLIALARVDKVVTALDGLRQDVEAAAIAAPVDDAIDTAVGLFQRAARFGVQQVGWGHLYAWRRGVYGEALGRIQARIDAWSDRLARFDSGLVDYDALPAGTSDIDRYNALGQLDLLLAREPVSPRPATPVDYRNALPGRRAALDAKLAQLRALVGTSEPRLSQLVADVQAVLPLTDFEFVAFEFEDIVAKLDAYVAELAGRVTALKAEVVRRLDAANAQLAAHDATADPLARIAALQAAGAALLGENVKLIPEFTVGAAQAAELANAVAASADPAFTQYARSRSGSPYPVEDWLLGVARARDKMRSWEQASLFAAALGASPRDLTPLQLPYRAGEGWLALDIDPAQPLEGERLLYTAHFAAAPGFTTATCGVLIDEWTEVVPARQETVGMTFHFDRPGSEPPQTWLLVTPARMQGRWRWGDVVGALDETLALTRLRAVEPAQVDATAYARFLPATTSAVTLYGVSIAANYALVNDVLARMPGGADG